MTRPDLSDERLDELLAAARASWRVAEDPDRDALWERIAHEHFDRSVASPVSPWRTPNWRMVGLAAAAALVIGTGVGRWTAPVADPMAMLTSPMATAPRFVEPLDDPMNRTTTEYLGETAALLTSLTRDSRDGAVNARFATDASSLLSTTRLLLDSPTGADPALRDLLDDLELVLAQIARLEARRSGDELQFITEAIEARDVVPRLRLAAADYHATAQ